MTDSIFAGMQPKIGDRNALQKWLDGLPDERRRQAAAVIAARAVLRALPTHAGSLTYFRVSALAWVAARYPARASVLPAYIDAFPAFSEAASVAAGEAAADIAVTASVASRVGNDFWHLVSADVVALEEGRSPSSLAGEPLLPKGAPSLMQILWGVAQENIMAKHWKPWKDWYQRRLDGVEISEEIELLFATLPMDPTTNNPAEPNARLAQEIERLTASAEERKEAILAAVAPRKPPPAPVENVSAPFAFGWTASAKLTIVAGPQNTPVFRFAMSEADHLARLEACRKLAERLAKFLRSGGINARPGYLRTLDEYLEDLPATPGQGNLLLGDFAARTLHGLLVEDSDILTPELKHPLTRVLEAHASLRDYYPSLGQFYADVKSGRLTQPLPIDAVESFVRTVEEHTPDVFDEKISQELQKVERVPEASAPSTAAARAATPTLPPDPLADVDPKKSHDFGVASSINALFKGFLNGKDISQSVKGWDEIAHKLAESAGPVIDWLKSFLP